MPTTVSHTALVTLQEIQRSAMRSDLWADNAHSDAGLAEAVIDIIADKSAAVENRLNRQLIVRQYETALNWELCPGGGYVARARQWPVVQVDTSGVTINNDGDLESTSLPGRVIYYAGYRRDDQDLETLQEHVPDLHVLPPKLPGDIRRVVINLVIVEARRQVSGTMGVASRSQTVAGEMVSFQRENMNVDNQLLGSLQQHRRIPI